MSETTNTENGNAVGGSRLKRFVMRLRWYNPWLIVKWVYCERDKHGLRLMKKEGTTFLWRAAATWLVVALCNKALMCVGFEYATGDFIITILPGPIAGVSYGD